MRAPKSIREVSTVETDAIKSIATRAQCDTEISDEKANAIIAHCNQQLTALGMPGGGLVCIRKNGKISL